MKQEELRRLAVCKGCGKKLGDSFREHHSLPLFWKVTMERFMLDDSALRRHTGLEMMTSPSIAAVMGPDEDLAQQVMEPVTICLCEHCAIEKQHVLGALAMEE